MMYIPKYFKIQEVVSPYVYNTVTNKDQLWWLFDDRLLKTADMLRDKYGPIIINNWAQGLKYSGFREESSTIGAKMSQHKHGRAFDLHPTKVTAEKMREDLLADPWAEEFQYITCIEINVSWFHMDVRNWNKKQDGVFIVKP